ncbi:MAG: hypothetical protein E7656_04355 [Ruminococcaceae bacterium]|nr:hypothetical protein [Oscillospiraceae bacterium]
MKKHLSLLICAVMLFTTVFSVFPASADTTSAVSTVYVSEAASPPSEIPQELVYSDISSALAAIPNGGTVYVCGDLSLPSSIAAAKSDKMTYIKGYPGSSARVVFPKTGVEVNRNITFDSLTVKGAAKDESWTKAVGCSLVFGSGCTYEASDPYTYGGKQVTTGIYIGHSDDYVGDAHYSFDAPGIVYNMIAPVALYSSAYTVKGDFVFDLNAGEFVSVYGGVRNGNNTASFQKLYGDVTYNLNGGSYGSVTTYNLSGGHIYGNVIFNVNGGSYPKSTKFILGNGRDLFMSNTLHSADYTTVGSLAIVVNADELEKNNADISSLTITEASHYADIGTQNSIIILNHAEKSGYLPTVSTKSVEYLVKVTNGKATPVFEASDNEGTVGAFLGFEIVPDNTGYLPYSGGVEIGLNGDGYYDIPMSTGNKLVEVYFENPLENEFFDVTFVDGANVISEVSVEGNNYVTLPICEYIKDGYCFAGWELDSKTYASGEKFVINSNTEFTAVFIKESDIKTVYVNGDTGNNANSGVSPYASVADFLTALNLVDKYSAQKLVIMSAIETGNINFPDSTNHLVITGKDGENDYGGSLLFTRTHTLNRPVTFEHMGLGCKEYQYICTKNLKTVFGDGLVPVGDRGIMAHFGNEYATTSSIDVEIRSGKFDRVFVGGAYYNSDRVGLAGNARVSISGVEAIPLTIGFDAYSGYDKNGSIEGSIEITVDNCNVEAVSSSHISEFNGALYFITYGSAIIPPIDEHPEALGGNYCIRVLSDGTVTAAVDEEGNIKHGYINAVCDSADRSVRLTNAIGTEAIYEQGEIAISSGEYTVEFIEKGYLNEVEFAVDEPVFGHKAEKTYYSTDKYIATGTWLCGDEEVDRFELDKEYTFSIHLIPGKAIDTDGFYDAAVNGNGATITENEDGSFAIEYLYGELTSGTVKYVSESKGSDSNNGSEKAPYKTLGAAIGAVGRTGGVVYVMDSVNGSSYKANANPVLVTGDGYPNAAIYLANNAGASLNGDITFDDISITMGTYSHFNDCGHKLVFGDEVDMDGYMAHVGTFNSKSVSSANVTVGKNTFFRTLHLGGGYHTRTTKVSGDVSINISGKVNNLSYGTDAYLSSQVAGAVEGNFLFTFDGYGSFDHMNEGARRLVVSDDTVFQFVFNNGANGMGSVPAELVPKNKLYTIYSGIGGRVLHAKDENGKSITGTFDVIPDKGYSAIISYNGNVALSHGGRYAFPPNTNVSISYMKSDTLIESYVVDLDGGREDGASFEIDSEGYITFLNSPLKKDHIFEGWYSDPERTQLIKSGDYIGGKIELYAKYEYFPMRDSDGVFAIRGVQMRVPNESSNIQGLRYITITDNAAFERIASFSEKNSPLLRPASGYDTHYGSVVMPTEILGVSELVLDGEYTVGGRTYKARSANSANIFNKTDEKTEYTVCLLNITPEKYEYAYTVRPYLIYYTRSGNRSVLYGNPYSIDVIKTTFAALESGNESEHAEEYMRETILPIYAQTRGIELLPTETLEMINEKTELYKQNILGSESMDLSGVTGTIYYVSPRGSDSNNGKSASTPWKSIAKVNSTTLRSGDAVLFERGGEYRGKITATAGVTYSAYGTGAKPIINGSAKNYADPSLWEKTNIENVYVLKDKVQNVGLMAFDHTGEIGKYDELVGTMRVSGVTYDGKCFNNQNDLDTDLHFYSNMSNGTLYLYSDRGNPGERFSSIELGSGGNLMVVSSRKNVTVDNLDFRYGGSHGVGGSGGLANYDSYGNLTSIGGCANLTVTNCLFSWIGGSILSGTTRFGNAVEIFGSVDGYLVQNNWIYQIYDTGVTHQISGSSVGNTHMRDILYKDNLIEYCHWSIEFYNQNCECCNSRETPIHVRIVEDVLSEGNIVRMGGYGWGSRIRKDGATLYNSFGLSRVASETRNFHAKDNIFFRCTGGMYRIYANASEDNLTFESNLWVQDFGGILAWYKNGSYAFLADAEDYITTTHLKEKNTQGVYFYAP